MLVMLKTNWPGNFRRTVRDEEGNSLRVLEFTPGKPVELTDKADVAAVADDVGPALLLVTRDDKGRPRTFRESAEDEAEAESAAQNSLTDEAAEAAATGESEGTAESAVHEASVPPSKRRKH